MVLSDDKSYCLVSSHIQHGLNYHSDRQSWPAPDQTTAGRYSLVVNIFWGNVIKSCFVQDSKDLREAIYHISKLS